MPGDGFERLASGVKAVLSFRESHKKHEKRREQVASAQGAGIAGPSAHSAIVGEWVS